jgi:hypothetical protein
MNSPPTGPPRHQIDHLPMSTRRYTRFRDDMSTVKARATLVAKELLFLATCAIRSPLKQPTRPPRTLNPPSR